MSTVAKYLLGEKKRQFLYFTTRPYSLQGMNPKVGYALHPPSASEGLYYITREGVVIARTERLRAFDRHILEVPVVCCIRRPLMHKRHPLPARLVIYLCVYLTGAVYRFLTAPELAKSYGNLHLESLGRKRRIRSLLTKTVV